MRVPAPAKINLHLRVGPRRDDHDDGGGGGFHPVLTWMCTVGLFDTLELHAAVDDPPGTDDSSAYCPLSLASDDPALPTDARNLVMRAATALADTLRANREGPRPGKRVSAFLNKRIPAGAGLGGGSSDAAATLVALNELWDARLTREQLATVGATIGSDVPFFLHATTSSVCSGRGEIVRPVQAPAARWALLVMPSVALATAAVYAQFDAMRLGEASAVANEPDWESWAALDAASLLPRLVNDLEPAAFAVEPRVGAIRSLLEEKLFRPVRMSGSGSALFTLFDTAAEAQHAARQQLATIDARVEVVELAPGNALPGGAGNEI